MTTASAAPTAPEIQKVTEEILRRPEFHAAAAARPASPGWLDRLFSWLSVHKIFGSIPLDTFITWALLALAAAALIYYLLRLLLAEPRNLRGARAAEVSSIAPKEPLPADPASLLADAEHALAAGDTRAAVQALYRAAVAALVAKGLLVIERWKTNLAYLRECPRTFERYEEFRELSSAYDEIVYAHKPPDQGKMAGLLVEARRLCESV